MILYDDLSRGHRRLAQEFELIEAGIGDTETHAYVGESVSDPQKYFENNIAGGLAFLHAVLNSPVRNIIFSSTCAVYGVPTPNATAPFCHPTMLDPDK